jgi:hypothetical protein
MVIHHVVSWEGAIAEVARVVKPSGFVIYRDFAVPNWVATLLARVTGGLRIPMELSLRLLAERFGLRPICASTRLIEAVWQRT